jgi:hypothetical protein
MALSKFALCCVAAVATGAVIGALRHEPTHARAAEAGTPVAAIADPQASFRDVAVESSSGIAFGHVIDVATDARGRAEQVRVALDGGRLLWLSGNGLVYSRERNVIVARDLHYPAMAIAEAR